MSSEEVWKKLVTDLKLADIAYYIRHDPIMSDEEYDALRRRCHELELQLNIPESESYTSRVAGSTSTALTVDRENKMFSLANVYNVVELMEFADTLEQKGLVSKDQILFYQDLKMDGISLEVSYSHLEDDLYHLTLATTRGDGFTGDNVLNRVTACVRVPNLVHWGDHRPKELPKDLKIRGEVVVSYVDLGLLNAAREKLDMKPFATARHAAGSLLSSDKGIEQYREVASLPPEWKPATFLVYGVDDISPGNRYGFTTHDGMIEALGIGLGFAIIPGKLRLGIKEVQKWHEEVELNRKNFPMLIDGTVFRINSFETSVKLGFTSHHPNFARAYKFQAEEVKTHVESITFQVGKSGKLTPVVNVKPVMCGGVTISKATLYNVGYLRTLNLHVGDIITLKRAGDVIPTVVSVDFYSRKKSAELITLPETCPECHSPVDKSDPLTWYCRNPECSAKLIQLLLRAVSRQHLFLKGFGEVLVEQLFHAKKLRHILDFFILTEADLVSVGVSPQYAKKLLIRIKEKLETLSLVQVLGMLGIPNVECSTAKILGDRYTSFEDLSNASVAELQQVSSVGPVTAQYIHDYFRTNNVVMDLQSRGIRLKTPSSPQPIHGPLSGEVICVTGTIEEMSRHDLHLTLQTLGATVTDTLNRKTTILLTGVNCGASKLKRADELGTKCWTMKTLIEHVGHDMWIANCVTSKPETSSSDMGASGSV